jgi:hypothetical protein
MLGSMDVRRRSGKLRKLLTAVAGKRATMILGNSVPLPGFVNRI